MSDTNVSQLHRGDKRTKIALGYARKGWALIPLHTIDEAGCSCEDIRCPSPGKHPRITGWVERATTDRRTINRWWERWPDANIGIATGRTSRLVVIDVDPHNGGQKSLAKLGLLPETLTARTGRGGVHIYFEYLNDPTVGCRNHLLPGIDVRADGGQVVAPPSSGAEQEYTWVNWGTLIAPLPDHILKRIQKGDTPHEEDAGDLLRTAQGLDKEKLNQRLRELPDHVRSRVVPLLRNDSLAVGKYKTPSEADFAVVIGMLKAGLTNVEAAAVWMRSRRGKAAAETHPLHDYLPRTVFNAVQAVNQGPRRNGGKADERVHLVMEDASRIEPQPVHWLWRGWLPRGKLTVIAGAAGLGKSTAALDLTGRISHGWAMPDGSPGVRGRVLIFSAEDDAKDTIVPRLAAVKADRSQVRIEAGAVDADGMATTFNLRDHLLALEETVAEHLPTLVIFDPLSAYVGRVDTHREAEVRGLLRPLSGLAERYAFGVIAIAHLNKGTDLGALMRITGSVAFGAAPRSVIGVAPDPDVEGQVVIGPIKSNLAARPKPLVYAIEGVMLREVVEEWDGDGFPTDYRPLSEPVPTSRLRWMGRKDVAVDDLMRGETEPASRLAEAAEFLVEELKNGPAAVKEVEKDAKAAGHSWKTTLRAKKSLGVVSKRVQHADRGMWVWRLPPAKATT